MRMLFALSLLAFAASAQARDDLSELYRSLKPSVVTVRTREAATRSGGLGSGVVLSSEGLVMTAAHVVHGANEIAVRFHDDRIIPAEIITSLANADLALLKLAYVPPDVAVAKLGDSDDVDVGNQVFVIGSPFGLSHSLSVGYISGKLERDRLADGALLQVLQTDAAVNQGNSGGPMFDEEGNLVGIVTSIASKGGGFDGISFAVAINSARSSLLSGSSLWTGFDGIFLGPEFAALLNVPADGGLLVQHVARNSMADRAGLRAGTQTTTLFNREVILGGDIILSIHGTTCTQPHDFSNIRDDLESLRDGDTFVIKVLRGGQQVELTGVVDRESWELL